MPDGFSPADLLRHDYRVDSREGRPFHFHSYCSHCYMYTYNSAMTKNRADPPIDCNGVRKGVTTTGVRVALE